MPGQNLIPIMIGIAGHRNYSKHSREALTSGVRSLIAWFRDTNPSTPLAILSSLAEGADQLCAEVALELGARVIVPLPFPPDVYRLSTSFASDEGRETLDRLLKADSVMWSVCPPPRRAAPKDKAGWAALSDEKESRQDCYMGAAAYISVHCHALIALWDGNTSDRPAGTYPLVRFKLTGELPDSHPYSRPAFQWADRGPVFVVHTPRDEGKEGRPLAPRPLGQVRELHPGDDPACFCAGLVWSEGRPPGTKTPRFFAWTDWIKPASVVSDAREEALARRNAERAQFAETCLRLDEFNREIKSFEEDAARGVTAVAGIIAG